VQVTPTRPDPPERALGLTRRLPDAYVTRCARIPPDAGANPCPPLKPEGQLKVAGPYGQPGSRTLDLGSGSLNSIGGAPVDTNGGHWTISVAWSASGRQLLDSQLHAIGRPRPTSPCTAASLEGERVGACRVLAYDAGGGYYGGHIAYAWQRGRLVYHITIHGFANEPRLRLMMAALIHRETTPVQARRAADRRPGNGPRLHLRYQVSGVARAGRAAT
jgi:hypothetical protein